MNRRFKNIIHHAPNFTFLFLFNFLHDNHWINIFPYLCLKLTVYLSPNKPMAVLRWFLFFFLFFLNVIWSFFPSFQKYRISMNWFNSKKRTPFNLYGRKFWVFSDLKGLHEIFYYGLQCLNEYKKWNKKYNFNFERMHVFRVGCPDIFFFPPTKNCVTENIKLKCLVYLFQTCHSRWLALTFDTKADTCRKRILKDFSPYKSIGTAFFIYIITHFYPRTVIFFVGVTLNNTILSSLNQGGWMDTDPHLLNLHFLSASLLFISHTSVTH